MSEDTAARATAPARWLLGAGVDGIALTQTNVLARAVVREAAERWPEWWDADVHGPPHREADVRVLEALREGLRRLGLVRRRGRRLFSTARGRQLSDDPAALLHVLSDDLGGGDEFSEVVAAAVADALIGREQAARDDLNGSAARLAASDGWRDARGEPPSARDVSWTVTEVLCRGEAYGLIERRTVAGKPRWSLAFALTEAGRHEFGAERETPTGGSAFIFDAELANARGVSARLAIGAEQHLTGLHDAIQEAFGWLDDHLYSFWLDGKFWGSKESEFITPDTPDHGVATADVPLAELALAPGAKIAYVFDFGDEWRVMLTLREQTNPDGQAYPRVLERKGSAPPQY